MSVSRRAFLAALSSAAALRPLSAASAPARVPGTVRWDYPLPVPARHWRGDSSVSAMLRWQGHGRPQQTVTPGVRRRFPSRDAASASRVEIASYLNDAFPDLRRHFVFEYYPWYATNPWRHWDQWGRTPPDDIAATYMPRLGPYDSRDRKVIEQHAEWIAELGVGAINISWWGQNSDTDRVVPHIMDVMRAHDIMVTFHLEPYADDRSTRYVDDINYLLRTYGDRRGWDAFLILENADGSQGPVFKSFATILPPQGIDCHGRIFPIGGYTADSAWSRETDRVREDWRRDFDHITLLADSLDMARTRAAGFDGIAIYDNYVSPDTWPTHASSSSAEGLLFSFNVNPGFDGIHLREVEPDSCYSPSRFEPGGKNYDWVQAQAREEARAASEERIRESFDATLALQADPALSNRRRGFFLVYINSFNEWHEGHQFEPMADAADLTPAQRRFNYHNPANGLYRHELLSRLLRPLGTVPGRVRPRAAAAETAVPV